MSKEHVQVKVCPRFRPFLKSDAESMAGDDKPKSCVAFHKNGKNFLIKNGSSEPPEYLFDKFLKATATQEEVFNSTNYGTEIVQRLTEGINCTIFAFGAEQTGKTFTLFGKNAVASTPNLGFASRVVRAIFDFIVNTSPPEIEFSVSMSSFEICGLDDGEALMTDLLNDDVASDSSVHLEVLVNDETNSVEIAGLYEEFVTSEVELFQSISKSLEKRSKEHSTLFFEIKLLQSDTNTKLTKEARLTIIDIDAEVSTDPHRKTRPTGFKSFQQVTEAIHSESDEFDYFETTLRCLLFSRIFINTASFGFITLSQSSLPAIVEKQTVPNLNLGNLLCEMSSEVSVNYVSLEGVTESSTPSSQPSSSTPSAKTEQSPPLPPKEQLTSQAVTSKKEEQQVVEESPITPSSPSSPVEEKAEISDSLFKKVLTEKHELNEQIRTFKTKVTELESELKKEHEAAVQYRKQASTAETSLSDLEKKFSQISELKDSLEKEKIRNDENSQKTHAEIQELKEKLIQADSAKDELNEKLSQKTKEINELKESVKKLESSASSNKPITSPVLGSRFSVSSNASGIDSSLSVKKMEIDAETVNVLKIQCEDYKKMYEEISEKLNQLEKKAIEDEDNYNSNAISQLASDDPSHQLIEKMKNKNKLLMEQLNLAKRENLKTREKAAEVALKNLDDKIYEYQQLFNQYQTTVEKSSRLSVSVNSSSTASLRSAFEDKGNSQKLKETVDDLTIKLNTARKKTTELEIAKMKAQETEKMHKEQIQNLENEIKKLKEDINKKQLTGTEEIQQLRKEIATLKESEETTKEQLKKLEQEKDEIYQKYKKSKAHRKKTLSTLQQSQESNTILLLQEREKVETLEREIKFLKKYTGVKIESFQQPKKGGDVIQPKKMDAQTSRSNSQIEREKLSQRMSVTVNKKHLNSLSNQLATFDVSQPFVDRKSVIAQEEEVYVRSPRPNILEKKFGVKPSSMNVDKHGYLEKKGPKLNMYKKRYFRIEGFYVYYFNDEADKFDKQLGCIDMRQVLNIEMIPEKSSKKRFVFRIEIPTRDYFLAAQTKEERDEWVDTLNQIKEKVRIK